MQEQENQNQDASQPDENQDGSETTKSESCPNCENYLNGWKRAQADYANIKKEMERSAISMSAIANERAVTGLLPALDQFETALEHVPELKDLPEEERKRLQAWIDGIKAVKNTWDQTLKGFGLESVDTSGVFDPNQHEAVGKEEDQTKPEEAILKTIRRGWMMNGKVIKPAMVIVNSFTGPNPS